MLFLYVIQCEKPSFIFLLCLGNVYRVPAVRGVPRWLLGHPGYGRNRLHLLLYRQDPGGLPVRDQRVRGDDEGALQLQRDCPGGLWQAVRRQDYQRGPAD